jgi:ribokinase
MSSVSVVGSLHLDIMVEAPRLPASDETLIGTAWHTRCGGKGGNQAVAAARFGAVTGFGGCIGQDDFGRRLRVNLEQAGVDVSCLALTTAQGSGMSVAISEASGEYGAIVVSGANGAIDAATIGENWAPLWRCGLLLLQDEVDEAVNLAAARAAKRGGARIVLNAAPARPMSPALLALVDVLVVNRLEARMMTGLEDLDEALARLAASTRDTIVTLGGDGLVLLERSGVHTRIAAFPVRLLSSHGAGDLFCGALAARFVAGDALPAACRFAAAAAALFVSTPADHRTEINEAAVRRLLRQPVGG